MQTKTYIFTDANLYSLSGRMAASIDAILAFEGKVISTFSGVNETPTQSRTFYGVIFYREGKTV